MISSCCCCCHFDSLLSVRDSQEPGLVDGRAQKAQAFGQVVRGQALELHRLLLSNASPPRNRSIAPMGGVRARVTWPCYVIANGSKSSHYPSRPNCLAWAPLSGRNPSR